MVVAIAVAFYAGLAFLIARFLSLNSRWERAVGALMDPEAGRLTPAALGPSAADPFVSLSAPRTVPPAARDGRRAEPARTRAAGSGDDAARPAREAAMAEEQELVEVGF